MRPRLALRAIQIALTTHLALLFAVPAAAIPRLPEASRWVSIRAAAPTENVPTDGYLDLGLVYTDQCAGNLDGALAVLELAVENTATSTPIDGDLSLQGAFAFWTPAATLSPNTTYQVSLTAKNEDLPQDCSFDSAPNLTLTFQFTTGAGLAQGPPPSPTVTATYFERDCASGRRLDVSFPPTSAFPYVEYTGRRSAGGNLNVQFIQGTYQVALDGAVDSDCLTVVGTHVLTQQSRETQVCATDVALTTLCGAADSGCSGANPSTTPVWPAAGLVSVLALYLLKRRRF